MRQRYQSRSDRAIRDIAAFLVVTGIAALIMRVGNEMLYEGLPGYIVPGIACLVLSAVSVAWIAWRLREYERDRRL